MRLSALLSTTEPHHLERLGRELLRTEEPLPPHILRTNLESALRSFPFVQGFLMNRQPPTFSIMMDLIDAPDHSDAESVLRQRVTGATDQICAAITEKESLRRDDQLRLYRRVFFEARRSDLEVDPSEASLLNVLRRELGISQVEHFLLEHHPDFHEFWRTENPYDHELAALRSTALLFVRDGRVVLPEDLVGVVGQALGVEMPTQSCRRLLALLSNEDLYRGLDLIGARTSGSKEERMERLLANRVQPRALLDLVHIGTLRELCRTTNANVSGSKDELIDRLVSHFTAGLDQTPREPESPVRPPEERTLTEQRFRLLFTGLRGRELTAILGSFPELRQSGHKDLRAGTLWDAAITEENFLSKLRNRDLEDILYRFDLGVSGSKHERMQRLILHFAVSPIEILTTPADDDAGSPEVTR